MLFNVNMTINILYRIYIFMYKYVYKDGYMLCTLVIVTITSMIIIIIKAY